MPASSRADRGAVLLLVLLALVLLLRGLWPGEEAQPAPAMVKLSAPSPASGALASSLPPLPVNVNTADSATLARLPGVGGPLARRIVRYRTAAGGFRSWAQLSRVWGMDTLLPRLQPMLTLGAGVSGAAPAGRAFRPPRPPGGRSAAPSVGAAPDTPAPPTPLDLNAADSAALEALPGIGPTFARRIVAYRRRLGFYHSIEQLKEVYGMPDSLFRIAAPHLVVGDLTDAERLNVNAYSAAELGAHPYIGPALARRIVAYREQHGPYRSADDLRRLYGLPPERLERLRPYLRVE